MRIGVASLLLLSAAAATLLTSCAANLTGANSPGGSPPTNPAKTTPVITWSQPAAIANPSPLTSTQLDATANVPGTFVYTPATGAVLSAGTQTLSTTFTPNDTAHYSAATASVSIVVKNGSLQPSTISWTAPSPITYPTPLGTAQLDAAGSAPDSLGTMVYTPGYGTVLTPGTHTLTATYTPNDNTDAPATAAVEITVNPAFDCASGSNTGARPFVYVSSVPFRSGQAQISGFASAADGSLTPVSGSPFATAGVDGMVGTGPILFGTDGYSIYSYAIHDNGCLSLENSAAVGDGDPANNFVGPTALFLDLKNANLYSNDFVPAEEGFFASYNYDSGSGKVTSTGTTGTTILYEWPSLAFDSSNQYAVTADSQIRGIGTSVFHRKNDGTLQFVSSAPEPALPADSSFYGYGAAADHAGHVIVAGYVCQDPPYCSSQGPWQLAVYTIDNSGNMTTSSTSQNMPGIPSISSRFNPNTYAFSPDDRYFAVSGFSGADIYTWDSTHAVLAHVASYNNTQSSCVQNQDCAGNLWGNLAWDRYDHLYLTFGNQLRVFSVTASGVSLAPGSPYSVQNLAWMAVVDASSD